MKESWIKQLHISISIKNLECLHYVWKYKKKCLRFLKILFSLKNVISSKDNALVKIDSMKP